ncbi:hypothetical protein V6N13_148324 [Hibiscus sabdariffa]|uniref:Uncharacterized protein n=1 Tax=Hibiscus sabdariffa TaxID=183260 RepID=A0ABR2TYI0_9ROSI
MQVNNKQRKLTQVKKGDSTSDGVLQGSHFDIRAFVQEDVEHRGYHEASSRPAQGVQNSFVPSALAKGKSAQQLRAES